MQYMIIPLRSSQQTGAREFGTPITCDTHGQLELQLDHMRMQPSYTDLVGVMVIDSYGAVTSFDKHWRELINHRLDVLRP